MTICACCIMETIYVSRASVLLVTIISAGTKFISYLWWFLVVCGSTRIKFIVVISVSFMKFDRLFMCRRNRVISLFNFWTTSRFDVFSVSKYSRFEIKCRVFWEKLLKFICFSLKVFLVYVYQNIPQTLTIGRDSEQFCSISKMLPCICEVPCYKFCWDADYHDEFSWVSQYLQVIVSTSTFQFIVHESSCHSTLRNLSYWQRR